jgi:hypothetical protein
MVYIHIYLKNKLNKYTVVNLSKILFFNIIIRKYALLRHSEAQPYLQNILGKAPQ